MSALKTLPSNYWWIMTVQSRIARTYRGEGDGQKSSTNERPMDSEWIVLLPTNVVVEARIAWNTQYVIHIWYTAWEDSIKMSLGDRIVTEVDAVMHGLDGLGSFGPWLKRVVKRICIRCHTQVWKFVKWFCQDLFCGYLRLYWWPVEGSRVASRKEPEGETGCRLWGPGFDAAVLAASTDWETARWFHGVCVCFQRYLVAPCGDGVFFSAQ